MVRRTGGGQYINLTPLANDRQFPRTTGHGQGLSSRAWGLCNAPPPLQRPSGVVGLLTGPPLRC